MSTRKLNEPTLGYIVLSAFGAGWLVFLPGEGIKFLPPEDPEWGNVVRELTQVLDSARALTEAGNKFPAIRQKCHAMAQELVASHEKKFRQVFEASTAAHA